MSSHAVLRSCPPVHPRAYMRCAVPCASIRIVARLDVVVLACVLLCPVYRVIVCCAHRDPWRLAGDVDSGQAKQLMLNQEKLKRMWEVSQRSTKEDWEEWMTQFSIELLRESPSPALRACCAVAQVHRPLARELFNASFVSCWSKLRPSYQEHLVQCFETAFSSPSIPPDILTHLLNLAEFMEHDEKALPIDIRVLGACWVCSYSFVVC